jgi:hypothetical protein
MQAVGMIFLSACVLLLLFFFMSRWFFYVLVGAGWVSQSGAFAILCSPSWWVGQKAMAS